MNPTKQQAINKALDGKWDQAIEINIQILKDSPDDIDTLNRLGFAYMSICDYKNAKKTFEKVLKIDDQNMIASKNLKKLDANQNLDAQTDVNLSNLKNIFLEEQGKTKIIDLLNVAEKKLIETLRCGQSLKIEAKRSRIQLSDAHGRYIGTLPDDMSQRLIKFIESGNEYEAYIKSSSHNYVTAFIKETKRSKKNLNQPSFQSFDKKDLSFDSFYKKAKKINN